MRKLSTLFAAVGLVMLVGGQAGAGPMPVNGTLTVALGSLGGPSLTGSGIGSSAGGVGSAATVPAGLLALTSPVSVVITPPAIGLTLITLPATTGSPVTNQAGSFTPQAPAQTPGDGGLPHGGTLGGAMGNNGIAKLYFGPTTSLPSCTGTNCIAGSVPLKYIGGGGNGMAVVAGLPVTVIGAVWNNLGVNATTPTKTLKIQKAAAGIPITITVTAFDKRTPGGAGTLQLVAPVNAKLAAGGLGILPVVGVLTLQFVPEPGTLLLVGSGIVGLVAFGRKRARG